MNRLHVQPTYAELLKTTNQSIASGDTNAIVTWQTISQSKGAILPSATNNWIEIDTPGYYIVTCGLRWDGEATPQNSTYRLMTIQWDTGGGFVDLRHPSLIRANDTATSDTIQSSTFPLGEVEPGTKLRMRAQQNTGETLSLLIGAGCRLHVLRMPMKIL